MKIDELTIGEAKSLAKLFGQPGSTEKHPYVGKYVIVRAARSGVHFGLLQAKESDEVILLNHRKLWQWVGAFTVSEIAKYGVETSSKLTETVDTNCISECIEIIPVTEESRKCLENLAAFKP